MRVFNCLAMLSIRAYQLTLARYFRWQGLRCRHHPSCSQYGMIAYAKYGFIKASIMTWKRFRDCYPRSGRPFVDFP